MGSHKKSRKRSTSPENDSDEETSHKTKKRSDSHSSSKKKSLKKRKHVSESDSSSSSDVSSSSSSESEQERRKLKKKLKKAKKKAKKERKDEGTSSDIPLDLMTKSRAMAPMTKEEWEKKQSVVRRVYDESTGRHRLIKGDGEVVEEIVSRDRHKAINQQATRGDGEFFQAQVGWATKK